MLWWNHSPDVLMNSWLTKWMLCCGEITAWMVWWTHDLPNGCYAAVKSQPGWYGELMTYQVDVTLWGNRSLDGMWTHDLPSGCYAVMKSQPRLYSELMTYQVDGMLRWNHSLDGMVNLWHTKWMLCCSEIIAWGLGKLVIHRMDVMLR